MELTLVRKVFTSASTIGELFIEDVFECFILEDTVRNGPKVYGKTAIPYGRYEIVISWSNRFKKLLPLLQDVPDFTGIRIHPGNTPADTEGCLLPGLTKAVDFVGRSRDAFNKLFPKLQAVFFTEKIWITIKKEDA